MDEKQEADFINSKKYPKGQDVFEIKKRENEKDSNEEDKEGTDAFFSSWSRHSRKLRDEKIYVLPTTRNAEEYNMGLAKRGKALLFHHTTFDTRLGLHKRKGSDVDKMALKKAVLHLGFDESDVMEYEDLSIHELLDALDKVAAMDHTEHDCLLVAICTHGIPSDRLYARDGSFSTEALWEPFAGHRCITLAGKPKMFFIQASQGEKVDSGVDVSYDEVDITIAHIRIPSYADLLIYYSTMPGYFSWRSPTNGSWYVQSLCKILKDKAYSMDLLSLLTLVNHRVANEYTSYSPENSEKDGKKQIPFISSMLTRKVVFKPKTSVKEPSK